MNVMAQAHKDTRSHISQTKGSYHYGKLLAFYLKLAHKEYKAECEASPVEWYSVEGHVVCPDTGIIIPVSEGSSSVAKAASDVLWYTTNFDKHFLRLVAIRENGSVRVEKPNSNYK
jgi:hypothetical protein